LLASIAIYRVLTVSWIIVAHVFLLSKSWLVENPKKFDEALLGHSFFLSEIIVNFYFAFDTLFVLVGAMASYAIFVNLGQANFGLISFVFQRLFR
jgi:hypothetical protein